MQNDKIEFSFFGIRGRANGRFAIVVLAALLAFAMVLAYFILH